METIKFGVHNSTLTTTYAYKFMNLGYEVMDTSSRVTLADSLIVTHLEQNNLISFHVQIPNHQFHFIVTPYDVNDTNITEVLYGYDDWVRDTNKSKTMATFEEVINYLKQRPMQGLEKYGSWYYLLSDGVLVQKPMSQGDTLKDAPLYDANDDELVVVCSTAFNDEERKEFDNDMKQLFGDSYNGLSAQSVG